MSAFCYVRSNVFTTNLLYTKMNSKIWQNHSKAKRSLTLSWLKPVCLGIGSAALVPASQPSKALT